MHECVHRRRQQYRLDPVRRDGQLPQRQQQQSGRLAERLEKLRPVLDATMAGVLRRIEERERAA